MKKVFAFVLAFTMVLAFGVVAFAADSPTAVTGGGADNVDLGWNFTTPVLAVEEPGLKLFDKNDANYDSVPEEDVILVPVSEADKLSDEDEDAFLAAYDEVQAIEGKVVKYFFWIDIPEQYKTDRLSWIKFDFKCAGENVEVTVNGNPMEVVHVAGVDYYAKLTELGAIAILCDEA